MPTRAVAVARSATTSRPAAGPAGLLVAGDAPDVEGVGEVALVGDCCTVTAPMWKTSKTAARTGGMRSTLAATAVARPPIARRRRHHGVGCGGGARIRPSTRSGSSAAGSGVAKSRPSAVSSRSSQSNSDIGQLLSQRDQCPVQA